MRGISFSPITASRWCRSLLSSRRSGGHPVSSRGILGTAQERGFIQSPRQFLAGGTSREREMKRTKKLTLARETLQTLDGIVGGIKIQCSVRICPPDQASEGVCTNTCTCSCG